MNENRFYILLSKKLTNELSPEENIELDILMAGNPEFNNISRLLLDSLLQPSAARPQQDEKILANLRAKLKIIDPALFVLDEEEKIFTPGSFWKRYKKGLIGSSLLVLGLAVVLSIFNLKEPNEPAKKPSFSENNISTNRGSKTEVKLPDGTLVILNADSKLSYPDNFLGNTREVTLQGEAFFKVTENKQKPFIIHSKAMDIKVLGTVFNVKAYPGESTSEATLIKGSIEVTLKNRTNEKIMLKPSEKITVSNFTEIPKLDIKKALGSSTKPIEHIPLIAVDQVSVDKKENIFKEIGWTQNKLMFKNETLESIVTTMQRWYGRTIEIKTEKLKDLKFTGNFTEESFVQVIQALQLSCNFSFKAENNSILIY
ncbi:MAG: FecR family protein [Ferruginibacter sp.]